MWGLRAGLPGRVVGRARSGSGEQDIQALRPVEERNEG